MHSPSLYDSFNARALSPEGVARIFIPNEDFIQLSRRTHTVVDGPRGSGKTALLKMLQPRALNSWDPLANVFDVKNVDFVGVYVPADVAWREQLDQLGVGGLSDSIANIFRRAAVTAHVLRSFISAVIDAISVSESKLPFVHIRLSVEQQREISKILSQRWGFDLEIFSLLELRRHIQARISDIWSLARKEAAFSSGNALPDNNKHLFLGFRDEIVFAVDIINGITGHEEKRWALLFDELEIAPSWLTEELFVNLRSSDQRILYKLAISPYSSTLRISKDTLSPSAGQDFHLIRLNSGYKGDSKDFCRRLFQASLADLGVSNADPERLLGVSPLKIAQQERGKAYKPGSANYRLIESCLKTDPSFAEFCERNHIILDQLEAISQGDRSSLLRKLLPTLRIRDAFRKISSQGAVVKRGRKKPALYAGFETFLEMLEGNPRWIIGITRDFAPYLKAGERVPPSIQLDLVSRAAERFSTILKTVPVSSAHEFSGVSLLDLLKSIADKIFHSIVFEDFSAEPVGSVKVDSSTPVALLDAIGAALNSGAMVSVSEADNGAVFGGELLGHRLRLTYLFSPIWRLPVRLGRDFSMSEIVPALSPNIRVSAPRKKKPLKSRADSGPSVQGELNF